MNDPGLELSTEKVRLPFAFCSITVRMLDRISIHRDIQGYEQLACSFVSFHDADAMKRSLTLLDDLVRDVSCLRFSFVPGADAVRFVFENIH